MKVWENSKKPWKHSPAARVPTAFLVLPNLHSCFYNSIETRKMHSFTSKVRFYGASFPGREEGICSKSVTNEGTSSTVFATTERTRRKLGIARIEREFSRN